MLKEMKDYKTTGFVSLIGLLAIMTVWVIKNKEPQPRMVVIDMKRAIETPSASLSRSKLTKEEQERVMKLFATYLPQVIEDYGKAHHLMIVSAPVLVSQKGMDITDLMINDTILRLKHA